LTGWPRSRSATRPPRRSARADRLRAAYPVRPAQRVYSSHQGARTGACLRGQPRPRDGKARPGAAFVSRGPSAPPPWPKAQKGQNTPFERPPAGNVPRRRPSGGTLA
jgi:hypothetical protein